MKKTMAIITILMFAYGCDGNNNRRVSTSETSTACWKNNYIERIDGCEYIRNPNAYGKVYTHKGNCDNPIHKCQRKCCLDNDEVKSVTLEKEK